MIHIYKDAQVSLFPVELSLEVEVQLKYPSIKGRTETPISFKESVVSFQDLLFYLMHSPLVTVFPLLINNGESNILIWRASRKDKQTSIGIVLVPDKVV
jgi:hypothetical protein